MGEFLAGCMDQEDIPDSPATQNCLQAESVTSVSSVTSDTSSSVISSLPVKRGRKPDTAEVKAAKEAQKLAAKEAKIQASLARKKAKLS